MAVEGEPKAIRPFPEAGSEDFFDSSNEVIRSHLGALDPWDRRLVVGYIYYGRVNPRVNPDRLRRIMARLREKKLRSLNPSIDEATEAQAIVDRGVRGAFAGGKSTKYKEPVVSAVSHIQEGASAAEAKPVPEVVKDTVREGNPQTNADNKPEGNQKPEPGYPDTTGARAHWREDVRPKRNEPKRETPVRKDYADKKVWSPELLDEYLRALARGDQFLLPLDRYPESIMVGGIIDQGRSVAKSLGILRSHRYAIIADGRTGTVRLNDHQGDVRYGERLGLMEARKGVLPENIHRRFRRWNTFATTEEDSGEAMLLLMGFFAKDSLRIGIDQSTIEVIFKTREFMPIGSLGNLIREIHRFDNERTTSGAQGLFEAHGLARYYGDITSGELIRSHI